MYVQENCARSLHFLVRLLAIGRRDEHNEEKSHKDAIQKILLTHKGRINIPPYFGSILTQLIKEGQPYPAARSGKDGRSHPRLKDRKNESQENAAD